MQQGNSKFLCGPSVWIQLGRKRMGDISEPELGLLWLQSLLRGPRRKSVVSLSLSLGVTNEYFRKKEVAGNYKNALSLPWSL